MFKGTSKNSRFERMIGKTSCGRLRPCWRRDFREFSALQLSYFRFKTVPRRSPARSIVTPPRRGGSVGEDGACCRRGSSALSAPSPAPARHYAAASRPCRLYGRLPERKDRFGYDGQADCSFVSGLLVRGFLPAGPDGICRSAPHLPCGLPALQRHSGLADRGLTCLPSHLVVPCATLSAATSCAGSLARRQPRLSRLADEVRLVHPVMGQQGPDRARRLVGDRDSDHVRRSPLGQAQRPCGRRLAFW